MKTYSKYLLITILSFTTLTFTSCDKDDDDNPTTPVTPVLPKLTIEFEHMAGNKKLYLDSTYMNANGDAFTPTLFKYYVSNVRLVGINNAEYKVPNSYYLIDQDAPNSREINISNLPAGTFKSIKFMIGVDSTRNVSGAQEGALDPVNGMFWSWNSGYIFLKIEGTSPVISGMGNEFSFHIGGFKGANINNREVEISFDGDQLTLANNTNPELHLVANVLELFVNPHTINLATFGPLVHMPNSNANMIADNYEKMFRYDHIHAD